MNLQTSFIILFTAIYTVRCISLNESKHLVSNLLETYDKRQRPVLNQSMPVMVQCGFVLKAIQDFSEVDGKLKVRGTLLMHWNDQSLVWDANRYGNMRSFPFPVSDIWYPKILLLNSHSEPSPIGKEWMHIRVSNDGNATMFGLEIFEVSCDADVTYFPFDKQTCNMVFIAFSNTFNEVLLLVKQSATGNPLIKQSLENRQWVLKKVTTRRVHRSRTPDLIVTTIEMKRMPAYLLVNIYLPTVFLAFINTLVFLLPPESGERISFAVTILLSLAVYMTIIENNLPKISKPMPWICHYIMLVLVQSVLVCVATIFNMRLFYSTSMENIPPRCLRFLTSLCKKGKQIPQSSLKENNGEDVSSVSYLETNCTESSVSWREISLFLDKICFVCFLSAIFTYNILYFAITLTMSGESNEYNPLNEILE